VLKKYSSKENRMVGMRIRRRHPGTHDKGERRIESVVSVHILHIEKRKRPERRGRGSLHR